MAEAALRPMTPEEFFAWHEQQEERYELVDGYPVLKFDNGPDMMAGATAAHDQIVVNLITGLRQRLRGGPCRVKSADQATRTARGNLRMPDVTIDCGRFVPSSYESIEPAVVFEVLSPSTRRSDLLRKVDEYQNVLSLRHFVILEPGRVWAIVWSRTAGGWGSDVHEDLSLELSLPAVSVSLPMAEIYEDVEFEV